MADAARREARRRRILENSENRLQKIFGTCKDDCENEKQSNDKSPLTPPVDNGFISSQSNSITKNKTTTKNELENFLKQDDGFNIQECEILEENNKYSPLDNHFAFTHSDEQYSLRNDTKDCDNLNFNPTTTSSDQEPCKKYQYTLLHILFFSNLSCIILAIFVNILLLAKVDFSLYKGIITPYIILAITRLCLQINSKESQDSNMLVAALILCNVKPEIVRNFKKIWSLCSSIPRDFALYITSFVLFNCLISIIWTNSSNLQFF